MAASLRTVKLHQHFLKLCKTFRIPQYRKYTSQPRFNASKCSLLLSFIPIATISAQTADKAKPFEPDDVRLRSSECLKNAAGMAVDSSSAVLSQTVYAIIKIEKEYVELLDVLVQLLEYQMEVLGQKAEADRIGDIVLETRFEINKVKQRKQDLALLFASVEKLADATAEVAFATGSDYASTSAGERLYSAQQEVKRVLEKSEKAEREVAYAESKMIEQLTRLDERMKEKEKLSQEEDEIVINMSMNDDNNSNVDDNNNSYSSNNENSDRYGDMPSGDSGGSVCYGEKYEMNDVQ